MWGLSEEVWISILGGAALVIAALLQAPKYLRNERTHIAQELEILNALPQDAASRQKLLAHIDEQISTLSGSGAKTRSGASIFLGLLFLVPSVYFTWQLFQADNGWWWLVSPLLMLGFALGFVGLDQGIRKHHRTATGRIIDPKKQPPAEPSEEVGGTPSEGSAQTAG